MSDTTLLGHRLHAPHLVAAFALLGASIALTVSTGAPWWLVAAGVIGPDTTGIVGDAVTGSTSTVKDVVTDTGKVPSAVVDAAGATTATTVRAVDDTVADVVEHVAPPRGPGHVVETVTTRPEPVVDAVEDIVHTATGSAHTPDGRSATEDEPADTDSGSDDSSSDSVARTVLDTVTSSAHLPR